MHNSQTLLLVANLPRASKIFTSGSQYIVFYSIKLFQESKDNAAENSVKDKNS